MDETPLGRTFVHDFTSVEADRPALSGPPGFVVVIPGVPVPQGRPRITTVGGFARAYDPPKSKRWKQGAQAYLRQVFKRPLAGPFALHLDVFNPCPKSHWRKRKPVGVRWDVRGGRGSGDADNFLKAFLDAGNKLSWDDDCLCVDARVRVFIQAQEQPPFVWGGIWPLA